MPWKTRLLFVLSFGGLGFLVGRTIADNTSHELVWWWVGFLIGAGVGVLTVTAELAFTRRLASEIPTILLGLAIGVICTLFSIPPLLFVVQGVFKLEDQYLVLGGVILVYVFTYLGITVIYQTRDRFRVHLPFLDLRRGQRDPTPIVVDTSAIIDGRLPAVCATGILDGALVIPRFVLNELQQLADSSQAQTRVRGKHGLKALQQLQAEDRVPIRFQETEPQSEEDTTDARLVVLARHIEGKLLTNDTNLERVAAIRGLPVISLNSLAEALKPVHLPGEELEIKLIRPGDRDDQGVGFLPSGVMVVVDNGRSRIGQEVRVEVRSAIQTSAGRMIFGRLKDD